MDGVLSVVGDPLNRSARPPGAEQILDGCVRVLGGLSRSGREIDADKPDCSSFAAAKQHWDLGGRPRSWGPTVVALAGGPISR